MFQSSCQSGLCVQLDAQWDGLFGDGGESFFQAHGHDC